MPAWRTDQPRYRIGVRFVTNTTRRVRDTVVHDLRALGFDIAAAEVRTGALAMNSYIRTADGLALDAGPFVAALAYAAGVRALVTGKPAAPLFQAALDDLRAQPAHAVMIGDDHENDIGAAARLGLRTVLVKTGKYRTGDEQRGERRPDRVAEDFRGAVDTLVAGLG